MPATVAVRVTGAPAVVPGVVATTIAVGAACETTGVETLVPLIRASAGTKVTTASTVPASTGESVTVAEPAVTGTEITAPEPYCTVAVPSGSVPSAAVIASSRFTARFAYAVSRTAAVAVVVIAVTRSSAAAVVASVNTPSASVKTAEMLCVPRGRPDGIGRAAPPPVTATGVPVATPSM